MLDFITGEAKYPPFQCVGCGSAKGPVVDTHREIPQLGRIYICQLCVQRAGIALGLLEGERMEELLAADAALRRTAGELEFANEKAEALADQVAKATSRYERAEDELGIALGRVAQLEDRLAAKAQADLQLVGRAD